MSDDTPPEPTFLVEPSTGIISIDWHGERPDRVVMTGEMLEQFIAQHNEMTTTLIEANTAMQTLMQRTAAMETLLTIVRLGRRPSRADWDSVQLPKLTREVRMDLMQRKRPTG